MHEEPPWFAENLRALEYTTQDDFNLHVICAPGTAHENINRCFDAATSNRVVILDDDMQILDPDPDWLSSVMRILDENQNVGQVTPLEIKEDQSRRLYLADKDAVLGIKAPPNFYAPWLPGYMMVFDMERTPDIRADEGIPFPTGMSDLDLSLQVRYAGYDCMACTSFAVWHPWKTDEETTLRCTKERDDAQFQFMLKKWGRFYVDSARVQLGMLLRVFPDELENQT